jgi:hypothetical protein
MINNTINKHKILNYYSNMKKKMYLILEGLKVSSIVLEKQEFNVVTTTSAFRSILFSRSFLLVYMNELFV